MKFRLLPLGFCVALVAHLGAAKIKVDAKYDKKYDFTRIKTYDWRPSSSGEVHLLQLSGDDPVALQKRFEPVIMRAVDRTLASRGLARAAGAPDVLVWYYVLIGPGMTAQTMGQFLPAVPEWGIPPFTPATQALEIYEQGTLILDIAGGDRVVWRGSARAEIDRQLDGAARDTRIETAVRDMLKKFPPKK
jgi:Domain of unknown function (DUF4136)